MRFRIWSCVVVLGLTLLRNCCRAATPQIVQSIVTETKPLKGTAYLNCTVAMMNSDAPINWIKMGEKKYLTEGLKVTAVNNQGRYDIFKNKGRSSIIPKMPGFESDMRLETYTLVIRDLRRDDTGDYKCMVDQSGLDAKDKPFAIGKLVVQSPAIIMPGPLLVPQVVNEFKELVLECNADGSPKPKVSWTRANGKPINVAPPPGQTQKPQRVYGKRLVIKNMTREDRGIYRCHAQNNVDMSSEHNVVVEVNFPPQAKVARKNGYYAQAPDGLFQVAVECIASGYPIPEVKFFKGYYDPPRYKPDELKDGPYQEVEKLYSYGAAGLSFDEIIYELRFFNVKSILFGVYTCLAENKFGRSNATLTLASQPICQGPLCYEFRSSEPLSGSALRPPSVLIVVLMLLLLFRR